MLLVVPTYIEKEPRVKRKDEKMNVKKKSFKRIDRLGRWYLSNTQ